MIIKLPNAKVVTFIYEQTICKTGLGQKPIGKTRGPLMANTIGLNSELSFISLRHFICAPQLTHSDPHLRCLRDVLGMPWDGFFLS